MGGSVGLRWLEPFLAGIHMYLLSNHPSYLGPLGSISSLIRNCNSPQRAPSRWHHQATICVCGFVIKWVCPRNGSFDLEHDDKP